MKAIAWIGALALALGASGVANAQQAPPPGAPPAGAGMDVDGPAPVAQPPLPAGYAPGTRLRGEWARCPAYGWCWIPAGAGTRVISGNPYAYFYTPHYGWTWHASPWGAGVYRPGVWAGYHPWGYHYAPHVWYRGGWVHPGWRR